MQDNFLSVGLFVDKHIQIVFFILHIDRDIDTGATNSDRNGFCVILIFKEEGEVLCHCCQFQGHKCKLNLGCGVTVDFSCAFE